VVVSLQEQLKGATLVVPASRLAGRMLQMHILPAVGCVLQYDRHWAADCSMQQAI
jgi:hypothetical protein